MKKNRTLIIVLFSILAIAIALLFYFNYNGNRYNWNESYKAQSDQPYGTAFIMKMLKTYTSGKFVCNTKNALPQLLDSAGHIKNTAYIFIGGSIYLDSLEANSLLNFVHSGNDAFIATPSPPYNLASKIYTQQCANEIDYLSNRTTSIATNFYHPEFSTNTPYSFSYRIQDKDWVYDWDYLNPAVLCDSTRDVVPLGYFDSARVNFFKIPYGKGNFYLHTNPILFTNYFLTKEINTEYAASVFSHLQHENILWDEFSKIPMSFGKDSSKSPLYFIMQQQSLRYAWWLLVITTLLYVFFTAKRKQRVIPVIEPKTNTSLQFMNMVASLRYHGQDHGDMARKKMKHFLHYLRTKYALSTHKIDDEFIKKLSAKSRVNEQTIELIFNQYRFIEKFQDISSARLAEFYSAIDNFYNQRK